MTHDSPLRGKRAVPLLRCSTKEQICTSIPDQLAAITRFCEMHGMDVLEAEELAGQSGSLSQNPEQAVERIIQRKRSGEPIDCVVFYDQSRLSRSGVDHFGHLVWKLRGEGIELAETDCYISDQSTAGIMRMLKAEAAHRQAKSTAQASTRGSQTALEAGRRAHCTQSPYGVDRLYKDSAGTPVYIIRVLEDGTRIKLHPETLQEEERYLKGQPFRKERMHSVDLLPGSAATRQTVVRIFQMHFDNKMGGHSIAATLNDEGVPSPRGGRWASSQIRAILDNPVYLGWAWANQHFSAIYFVRSPTGPVEAGGQDGARKRGIRPADQWIRVEYPALKEYLPERLRPLAERRIQACHERLKDGRTRGEGNVRGQGGDNGLTTGLLSGILKEASTGGVMKLTSQHQQKYLYYRVRRKDSHPSRKSPPDVPACPLDRAVLTEIERLLCSAGTLRESMVAEIRRQQRERLQGRAEIESIDERLHRAQKRHASLLRQLGGPDEKAVEEAIAEARAEIAALTDKLQSLGGRELSDEEIDELADSVIDKLSALIDDLHEARDPALRRLAELLVDEAVVDAATRQARFRFAVPTALIADSELGLEGGPELKPTFQTNKWQAIPISSISLTLPPRCNRHCHRKVKPKGCGPCRRQPMNDIGNTPSEAA